MTKFSNEFPTSELQRIDAAHHLHPFTDTAELNSVGSSVIVKADGVWLQDSDGNRILDGMAGLWCVNIGHGRKEIAEAVRQQMRDLSYYNTFFNTTHPPAAELSEKVTQLAPAKFNHVFFTSSGSEANDTVIRMARTYWDIMGKPSKTTIISRWNAYHGSTLAGASLGGMKKMHEQGDLPVGGIHHINQPYWFGEGGELEPGEFGLKVARELETAIDQLGEDHVAAFIAEPIQGAGGVIIPPDTYWPEINRICQERDILLVVDEVICGFGRLGEWFGSEYFKISPDIMPIAKGLSSGYLPIGGVLVGDRVANVLIDKGGEFYHGYTYSGHPTCCVAALVNLEIMKNEKIIEGVQSDKAIYLKEKWLQLKDHPLVGEARVAGLLGALELVPDKKNPRGMKFENEGDVGTLCRDKAFNNGLVMRGVRDSVVISPPLIISHDEIDELVRLAEVTLDETYSELKQTGRIVE